MELLKDRMGHASGVCFSPEEARVIRVYEAQVKLRRRVHEAYVTHSKAQARIMEASQELTKAYQYPDDKADEK